MTIVFIETRDQNTNTQIKGYVKTTGPRGEASEETNHANTFMAPRLGGLQIMIFLPQLSRVLELEVCNYYTQPSKAV